MKLIMHQKACLIEERVEIYYREMNAQIQKIVDCIEESLYIQGTLEEEKCSLPIHDIYYFDTVDKMNFAYLKDKVYKVAHTLQDIEEGLKSNGFVRISKSVVVNIFKIESITSEVNMRIKVHLENGEGLVVSRHYKKTFNEALKSLQKQLKGERR